MIPSCNGSQANKKEIILIPPHIHPLILLDELLLSHYDPKQITRYTYSSSTSVKSTRKNTTDTTDDTINTDTLNTLIGKAVDTSSTMIPSPVISDKRNRNHDRLTNAPMQKRVFQIIKGADFICSEAVGLITGSSPSSLPPLSSILESALELLDGDSSVMGMRGNASPNGRKRTSAAVRLIRALPSGRSFLVVTRCKSVARKRKKKKYNFADSQNEDDDDGNDPLECLCLLGNTRTVQKDRHVSSETVEQDSGAKMSSSILAPSTIATGKMGFYCSCQSFFERLQHDRYAVCKHLMAARLAPFLSCCDIYQEDDVSEEEFAKLFLQYSLS